MTTIYLLGDRHGCGIIPVFREMLVPAKPVPHLIVTCTNAKGEDMTQRRNIENGGVKQREPVSDSRSDK